MKWYRALVLVGLLCLPLAATIGTGASAYVSITGVSLSPQQPAPGELLTVTPTIRNLKDSSGVYDVTAVALRSGPDSSFTEYTRVTDLGTLAPGTELSVPLTVTFSKPGLHRLRVRVFGRDGNGHSVSVQYPLVVRVSNQHPQLDVQADAPVANADTTVNVTVANGLAADVTNVAMTLDGAGVHVSRPRRVTSRIGTGETNTFDYSVRAKTPGEKTLTATLRYTTADGTTRTATKQTTVRFKPLRTNVSLDATQVGSQANPAIAVTVTNLGNAALDNLTISGRSPNATVSRALLDSLAPRSKRTVRLNVSNAGPGSLPVSLGATYHVGDRRGTASTSLTLTSHPATIRLTGIDVERQDGKLHITGSTSNVGLSDADSVVVSVLPAAGVTPAYPHKEYFVGTVPKSNFVSFDVYATVDANATEVPLRVSYLSNGQRRTHVTAISYDGAGQQAGSGSSDTGSGGLLVPAALGLVVVAAVGAVVFVAWRNRDGGA